MPDGSLGQDGHFGKFGGSYIPEILVATFDELVAWVGEAMEANRMKRDGGRS